MHDKLANVFDLEPIDNFDIFEGETTPEVTELSETLVESDETKDPSIEAAEGDFDEVRALMKKLLVKGQKVLETAELVAVSSQNSKDIDAFFKGSDSITKTARELMAVHKEIISIKPMPIEEPKTQQAETINNIVFQGSTGDFIQMLREQKLIENKKKEDE